MTIRVFVVAVLAGLTLGIGDLWALTHLEYPWAGLANSAGGWALVAFGLAAALRTDPVRAAGGAVLMLLVAVESYYGFADAFGLGNRAGMWSGHARMWLVAGVLAGTVFGVAGAWARSPQWWLRLLGAATGGLVVALTVAELGYGAVS